MGKVFLYLLVVALVSCYLFPFGLTFLPPGINTKNILALVGMPLLVYHLIRKGDLSMSGQLLGAVVFAALFSLICFFAADYNQTDDLAYATYIVSFSVWMFGAFTVCEAIRAVHGAASFRRLVFYMALACAAQCVLALMIDRIPAFQMLVDTYIDQGQEFLQEVERLYGIGASLDPAGVRFSVVLVLLAALLVKDIEVRQNRLVMVGLLTLFFIIVLIGNMISRTTIIGAIIALFYFIQATGIFRLVLKTEFLKFHAVFGGMLLLVAGIAIHFYNTDPEFYGHIRFAFEGFFNWVEKGEWRTDSTDKLNSVMWIWPSDTKSWIIGTGLFDGWVYGTDIGYCRFILYCGLVGFSVFAAFFVYNAYVFGNNNPNYRDLFLYLLVLTFVVWVKVATDIFTFYALFYCLDYFTEPRRQPSTAERRPILSHENHLLHSSHA